MAFSNFPVRVFFVVILLSNSLAQDFEPDPLEPETEYDTTTPKSESTTTGISTDTPINPTETTTSSPTTTASSAPTTTTTSTSTEISSNTPGDTSTTASIPTTTSTPASTSTPTSTLPISTSTEASTNNPQSTSTTSRPTNGKPYHTTTKSPFYPSKPAQCYFKRQRGPLQSYWTCQGPQWTYAVECYYCCLGENSMFAGCNRVDFSYCEWYN